MDWARFGWWLDKWLVRAWCALVLGLLATVVGATVYAILFMPR
jgi:hypothetical protein